METISLAKPVGFVGSSKDWKKTAEYKQLVVERNRSAAGKASRAKYQASAKGKATSTKNAAKWQAAHPERVKNGKLQRAYGLNLKMFNSMADRQGWVCLICKSVSPDPKGLRPGKAKTLHVDHNHRSGTVRALLCDHCNTGLGLFGDSISRLQDAVQYLLDHQ